MSKPRLVDALIVALYILFVVLLAAGCATVNSQAQYRAANASERAASQLLTLKQTVDDWRKAGVIGDADWSAWRGFFSTAVSTGEDVNQTLRTGDGFSVGFLARRGIDAIDEMLTGTVPHLPSAQQHTARDLLLGVRMWWEILVTAAGS